MTFISTTTKFCYIRWTAKYITISDVCSGLKLGALTRRTVFYFSYQLSKYLKVTDLYYSMLQQHPTISLSIVSCSGTTGATVVLPVAI